MIKSLIIVINLPFNLSAFRGESVGLDIQPQETGLLLGCEALA